MFKKLYIGNYKENKEADLSQPIVLEEDGKSQILTCTTFGGLLQMLSVQDKEIIKLKDALEECGKLECPICGDITEKGNMTWSNSANAYICAECAWEE